MYAIPNFEGVITDMMSSGMSQYKERWGLRPSFVETMTLDPSSKIIKKSEINSIKNKMRELAMKELNESGWDRKVAQKWDKIINNDDGVFATLLGYDAIYVDIKGPNDYPEIVILNRTKIIFLGE